MNQIPRLFIQQPFGLVIAGKAGGTLRMTPFRQLWNTVQQLVTPVYVNLPFLPVFPVFLQHLLSFMFSIGSNTHKMEINLIDQNKFVRCLFPVQLTETTSPALSVTLCTLVLPCTQSNGIPLEASLQNFCMHTWSSIQKHFSAFSHMTWRCWDAWGEGQSSRWRYRFTTISIHTWLHPGNAPEHFRDRLHVWGGWGDFTQVNFIFQIKLSVVLIHRQWYIWMYVDLLKSL